MDQLPLRSLQSPFYCTLLINVKYLYQAVSFYLVFTGCVYSLASVIKQKTNYSSIALGNSYNSKYSISQREKKSILFEFFQQFLELISVWSSLAVWLSLLFTFCISEGIERMSGQKVKNVETGWEFEGWSSAVCRMLHHILNCVKKLDIFCMYLHILCSNRKAKSTSVPG